LKIKIGIIGTSGYWGRKILKILNSLLNFELIACAGYSNSAKLTEVVKANYFRSPTPVETLKYKEIIQLDLIDAVIISTPAESHYSIAKKSLESGKHVFLEKPMCLNSGEAKKLVQLANKIGKILFIDHTYLHSKCLQFIKNKLENKELGAKVFSFHTNRTQIGIYRIHNVLWDLGPHDISMIKFLFPNQIIKNIMVTPSINFQLTKDHQSRRTEDVMFYKLSYESGFSASTFISWCHPKRARDIIIIGENKMILFENNDKVTIFEHNLSSMKIHQEIQWNKIEEYSAPDDNPLSNSLQCFYNCVINKNSAKFDYLSPEFGYDIILTLERIQKAISG